MRGEMVTVILFKDIAPFYHARLFYIFINVILLHFFCTLFTFSFVSAWDYHNPHRSCILFLLFHLRRSYGFMIIICIQAYARTLVCVCVLSEYMCIVFFYTHFLGFNRKQLTVLYSFSREIKLPEFRFMWSPCWRSLPHMVMSSVEDLFSSKMLFSAIFYWRKFPVKNGRPCGRYWRFLS